MSIFRAKTNAFARMMLDYAKEQDQSKANPLITIDGTPFLKFALEAIRSEHGSIEAFLIAELGVSFADLKRLKGTSNKLTYPLSETPDIGSGISEQGHTPQCLSLFGKADECQGLSQKFAYFQRYCRVCCSYPDHLVHELDPTDASHYINRELSQLEFCHRVLAMARNPDLPLLERVRYLSITSGILNEFFEIRVAGVKQQETHGTLQRDADELSAHELLKNIFARTEILVAGLCATLNDDLIPALSKEGFDFCVLAIEQQIAGLAKPRFTFLARWLRLSHQSGWINIRFLSQQTKTLHL